MLSNYCFAERPPARYGPDLIFVHAVALVYVAVQPSKRLARLLHSLAQVKCQVHVVTVSAVDFVDRLATLADAVTHVEIPAQPTKTAARLLHSLRRLKAFSQETPRLLSGARR